MDDLSGWAAALAATHVAALDQALQICQLCVPALRVSGGGISVVTEAGNRGVVCFTDEISGRIEELQFTLGEGPCVRAVALGAPVLIEDVRQAQDAEVRRWPTFAASAGAGGVGAVFAFPLRLGGVTVGAMDLYRATPGSLSENELLAALLAADAAAIALGSLKVDAEPSPSSVDDRFGYDMRIHQATGMVMIQLGIPADDALSTLRARAFSTGRSLTAVAVDVLERKLRFNGLAVDTEEDDDQSL